MRVNIARLIVGIKRAKALHYVKEQLRVPGFVFRLVNENIRQSLFENRHSQSGVSRIRTDDLLLAKEVLCQLSYDPRSRSRCLRYGGMYV